MAMENKLTEEQLFDQLISSLVHSSWVSLGKVKNPMNDALERNLDQASVQIDMLDMLLKRMSGNLSENEEKYLGHLVRELKMNFVEEKNKPTEEKKEEGEDKEEVGNKDEEKRKKKKGKSKQTKVEEKKEETEEEKNEKNEKSGDGK
jgi:outer membrane biosynthesis protein TonB